MEVNGLGAYREQRYGSGMTAENGNKLVDQLAMLALVGDELQAHSIAGVHNANKGGDFNLRVRST